MDIKGLDFQCTSIASPEQYDVFDGNGDIVGFVRLRWGTLYCESPDFDGEMIYRANIGDAWTGSFESEEQREIHLNIIADKILNKIHAVEESEFCKCNKTEHMYKYYGYWNVCECGFKNIEDAEYCGGCGRKIEVGF